MKKQMTNNEYNDGFYQWKFEKNNDVEEIVKKVMDRLEDSAVEYLGEGAWAEAEMIDQDDKYYDILLRFGVGWNEFTEQYKFDKKTLELFES